MAISPRPGARREDGGAHDAGGTAPRQRGRHPQTLGEDTGQELPDGLQAHEHHGVHRERATAHGVGDAGLQQRVRGHELGRDAEAHAAQRQHGKRGPARGGQPDQAETGEGGSAGHDPRKRRRTRPRGEKKGRGQGPGPRRRHEAAEPARIQVEHAHGEQRQKHRVRRADEARDQQQQEPAHAGRARGKAQPLHEPTPPGARSGRRTRGGGDGQKRGEDRQEAQPVDEEAPPFADPVDQQTADGRPHHPRRMEHGRIERDGIHQVRLADQVAQERLAHGDVECVHTTDGHGHRQQVADAHGAAQGQSGQGEGQHHLCALRGQKGTPPIAAVGHQSAHRGRRKRETRWRIQSFQQRRRARQPVDEPELRRGLHPGPEQGGELPCEEDAEIAVPERRPAGGEEREHPLAYRDLPHCLARRAVRERAAAAGIR